MWFPVHFRFLAHSLTTFGRWGCGEQINLSHVVGNFIVVLLEMSRLVAPETRSQTLRRTKRVLNARQGMEGAKTLTEALRRSGAPKPRASGLRSSPELRDSAPRPPARPNRTGLVATRLVGGRRPSVLQRWGSGVLPRRFPVALKALPEPCCWRGQGRRSRPLQGPLCEIERSEM